MSCSICHERDGVCHFCGEQVDPTERAAALHGVVKMILHCPACGLQHIDAPEAPVMVAGNAGMWTNPPHRSHLCAGCGHIWRPADVPTEGVAAIETCGKSDSPTVQPVRRMCSTCGQPQFVEHEHMGKGRVIRERDR
jgi:hypothetical protein